MASLDGKPVLFPVISSEPVDRLGNDHTEDWQHDGRTGRQASNLTDNSMGSATSISLSILIVLSIALSLIVQNIFDL